MRIFALELDNDIRGIPQRLEYIEGLIARLPSPDLVVLPELAVCGYMAHPDMWKYADECGQRTAEWAVRMAEKYDTCIGAGYLDRENGEYYNRYLIAGKDGVYGTVTKSEGESAVFQRGAFPNVIETPFGHVGVAICYDSRRRGFYDRVKDKELSLILFPHGCPADPSKIREEQEENDIRCQKYVRAFGVPVVYVNSTGALAEMPGVMGGLMKKLGFRMNGLSRIYADGGMPLESSVPEAIGIDIDLKESRLREPIHFYGKDILPGNRLFQWLILKPDTLAGILYYRLHHKDR